MIDIHTFYDEHPINEREILSNVAADGKTITELKPDDLWPYDQDHYGGLEANDALAAALQIDASSLVLDLCSGMGGPARYLAATYGCQVQGVDLNHSRVDGATSLTNVVGLSNQVRFEQGDVCQLSFQDEAFDVAISQEAFLHVPAKAKLLAECFRVLAPGGRLGFTDWTASESLNAAHRQRFAETFAAEHILSQDEYIELLSQSGFRNVAVVDLSTEWREILHGRLDMFRALEADTVAQFGQERHDTYIRNYEFFVARIDAADLGGARVVGWK